MAKYNNDNAQANNEKEALRAELVTTITIKGMSSSTAQGDLYWSNAMREMLVVVIKGMAPGETITLSDDGRIKVELKKFRERREAVEAVTLQDLMG